jgi:S1-C subfamily serine protease
MKKTILLCVLSAAIGMGLAEMVRQFEPNQPAAAQEQPGKAKLTFAPGTVNPPAPRATLKAPQEPLPELGEGKPVPLGALTPEERVNIAVYETVNRGVVNINTKSVRNDGFFFGESATEGSGSGSVIDMQGHILTNFHVVDGAQQIEATLASGNTYPAKLIGHDLTDDIAVLKIDAPAAELHPIVLGESGALRVGQKVFAIGNPFGLERTLTIGILSSLNRSLSSRRAHHYMKTMIQVDAAMNPGNSGGPLIDSGARMIGMNTAIASKTGQNTGVGFAIPVNRLKRIVPELISHGRVARAELGITQVMVTERGLLVAAVADDGPAAKAGLQGFRIVRKREQRGPFVYETQSVDRNSADLITHVEGKPIQTVEDLLGLVEEKQPGQELELTVIRANKPMRVRVKLGDGES